MITKPTLSTQKRNITPPKGSFKTSYLQPPILRAITSRQHPKPQTTSIRHQPPTPNIYYYYVARLISCVYIVFMFFLLLEINSIFRIYNTAHFTCTPSHQPFSDQSSLERKISWQSNKYIIRP